MTLPWCPNIEHVTHDPWRCGACGEHGCVLCEEGVYRTVEGERLCEGCWEKAPVASLDGPSLMARMDKAMAALAKARGA